MSANNKMKRTQIYLTAEQWRALSLLSEQSHRSLAQIIRDCIDATLMQKNSNDVENVLKSVFGIWSDRKDLPATEKFVRDLRKGRRIDAVGDKK